MNQKKKAKITQTEIDLAKEEYFKNGGVIKILKNEEANPIKVIDAKRVVNGRWIDY